MTTSDTADATGSVIAFRASAELMAKADSVAAAEGISRSDVARRALMRDVLRREAGTVRLADTPLKSSVRRTGPSDAPLNCGPG